MSEKFDELMFNLIGQVSKYGQECNGQDVPSGNGLIDAKDAIRAYVKTLLLENRELVADKIHLINAAMDGGDKYHYTARDIGYRDMERKLKALEADLVISNRELLIKQVEINRLTAELALREQVRWRKYPEEKPPVDGRYLIYSDGSIHLRYLEDGKFIEYINQEYNVTHWMPLPQPPEAE